MSNRKPVEFRDFPAELAALAPYGPFRGVVKEWVDGDTLDVFCDPGCFAYPYVTVRLAGVGAPEKRGADRLAGLLAWRFAFRLAPPGTPCVVETAGVEVVDGFRRLVGRIGLAGGIDVGAALVRAGHADPRP